MKTYLTDYGQLSVYKNKAVFSIPWRSKLVGYFLIIGISIPLGIMFFSHFTLSDFLRFFKDGWFFIIPVSYVIARYSGGFRDSLEINKKQKKIRAARHFLFIPYRIQCYRFDQLKAIQHYDVEYEQKRSLSYFQSVAKFTFQDKNSISAASITNSDLEKSRFSINAIIIVLKDFTGCRTVSFDGIKKVKDASKSPDTEKEHKGI